MKANRAFELIVRRDGLGPAFLTDRGSTVTIHLVSVDDGEVVLFWDVPARRGARLLRSLRSDLASLQDDEFIERWRDGSRATS